MGMDSDTTMLTVNVEYSGTHNPCLAGLGREFGQDCLFEYPAGCGTNPFAELDDVAYPSGTIYVMF